MRACLITLHIRDQHIRPTKYQEWCAEYVQMENVLEKENRICVESHRVETRKEGYTLMKTHLPMYRNITRTSTHIHTSVCQYISIIF